jgi:cell division initiation protein
MIDLTPVEVRKKKNDFRRAMRGYDPAQVDDFIDLVADRLEQLVREHASLSDRVGRQDQQIAEYRERERALTEALVSAQEIREEMRKQAVREAELAKSSAHEESSQVRAAAQQEVQQLRTLAEREAFELRKEAERETAALRADAERYAAELRAAAERDAAELRGTAAEQRKREEQVLDNLRAHQETLLSTYREFLERELQEITSAAETFGVDASAPAFPLPAAPPPAAAAPSPAPAAPPAQPAVHAAAPAAPARVASAVIAGSAITLAPEPGSGSDSGAFEPAATSGANDTLSYSPPTLADSGPDMGALDMSAFGTTSFTPAAETPAAAPSDASTSFDASAFGLRSSFDQPTQQQQAPAPAAAPFEEPPSFDASYPHAAPVAPEDEPFAPEPFEPEPFEPEPFDPDDLDAEDDPQELPLLSYEEPEAEPVSASTLYDAIATPEPDGVPGPIGLAPSQFAWGEDLEDDEAADDEDEETARLLRNAAAAGYRLPDDDELLLEEAVEEETEKGKGSGWLPNLLEDDS